MKSTAWHYEKKNTECVTNYSCSFRVGSNEIMGCCAVGPRYIGPGRDHWFEMLENPRKPIAQWYSLNEHVPGASNDPTPNGKSTSPNNQQGADEQQAAK